MHCIELRPSASMILVCSL